MYSYSFGLWTTFVFYSVSAGRTGSNQSKQFRSVPGSGRFNIASSGFGSTATQSDLSSMAAGGGSSVRAGFSGIKSPKVQSARSFGGPTQPPLRVVGSGGPDISTTTTTTTTPLPVRTTRKLTKPQTTTSTATTTKTTTTTTSTTTTPITQRPIYTQNPEWFEDARLLTLTMKNFEFQSEYADRSSPDHLQLKRDVESMVSATLLEVETFDSLFDEGWTGEYRYKEQEECSDPWSSFILSMLPGSTMMMMKMQPPRGVKDMSKQTAALNGITSQANRRKHRRAMTQTNVFSSTKSRQRRDICGPRPNPYEVLDISPEDAIELLLRNGPTLTLEYNAFDDLCTYLKARFDGKCADQNAIAGCDLDFCTAYAHRCELVPLEQIPWLVDPCKPNEAEQPGDYLECLIGCDFEGGLGSCAYRLEVPIVNHTDGLQESGFVQARVIRHDDGVSRADGRHTRSRPVSSRTTVILREFVAHGNDTSDRFLNRREIDDSNDGLQYDPLHGQRGVNKALKAEGSYYGAMYVMPSKSVIIDLNTELKTTRLISFKYYAATHGVLFKACCSDDVCPFTAAFDPRTFRQWQSERLLCPKGSDKIHFVCHATGKEQGACGIDDIRLNYFDTQLLDGFGGLQYYPMKNACEEDDEYVDLKT